VASGHRRTVWYGVGGSVDLRCDAWGVTGGAIHADLSWAGSHFAVQVPLVGRHNLDNLLAACACSLLAGIASSAITAAAATFPGVRRRLDLLGEAAGIAVVDDFAHHPTAVRLTLEGARSRFPGRRLVVVFEPRSLTAGRAGFAHEYEEALARADVALVAPVFHRKRLAPEQVLDRGGLAAALTRRGTVAAALPDDVDPLAPVRAFLKPGDVVVCMSSGDFGGLPRRLLETLRDGA
jgi:UDP-N-acetylmuramate: L-alanyl-gamma-D-glutamyl-meso-diaminopimelate ligase